MRTRATVAAVSGALALSASAVPAAHADGSASHADLAKAWGAAAPVSGKSAFSSAAAAPAPEVTFSNVKVYKGKAIVVGATKKVSVPAAYSVTYGAGLDSSPDNFASGPILYLGSITAPTGILSGDDPGTCTATSATTADCTGLIDIHPGDGELWNSDAKTWKVGAVGVTAAGGIKWQGDLGTSKLQRYSKLTANASPEPVKKGRTITVKGALTRANWETNKYSGYTGQSVALQFKKKGSTTYTTVKTITSGTAGALKTTVKASADGYYRFTFAGTSNTAASKAKGDFIDVQ